MEHLNRFLPCDIGPPSDILEVDDCLEKEVSPEVVDTVQQVVLKLKKDIEDQLGGLGKLKVTTIAESAKRKPKKK